MGLTAQGYQTLEAANGKAALDLLKEAPDLIILDLGLPDTLGHDLLRTVRARNDGVPIIVLSSRGDEASKVQALDLGADDYVTKPFSPRELLARVQAAMRRATRLAAAPEIFAFDDISVNFTKMELTQAGKLVPLTAQEFKVLRFFIPNQDRVISREEFLNEVWGYQNYPSTRTVDNHILRLRQKLEKDPSRPHYFRTMHGAGYKFVR
jgi:DNA-binding response OmpR family regulator